jgi:hypothetical protein
MVAKRASRPRFDNFAGEGWLESEEFTGSEEFILGLIAQ